MSGDDAVVEDVFHVGLVGEAAHDGGVVDGGLGGGLGGSLGGGVSGNGLHGGDPEVLTGNGGVAIDDKVTVRSEAGGVDLRVEGVREHQEGEDAEESIAMPCDVPRAIPRAVP